MIATYFQKLYERSSFLNQENILRVASQFSGGRLLDVGCDNGKWTQQLGKVSKASELWGIEINSGPAEECRSKGIKVINQDLNNVWNVNESYFDIIHANQVIEHVPNVDFFLHETFKALKPGGTVIVSTENGSSWHNIFAAIMGWQIFSLTNMSSLAVGVGNPLALNRGSGTPQSGWTHKTIFNYLGLIEFFKIHGFVSITIQGAGYHPLPAVCGRWDVRHAHFITLAATKPL